MAQANPTQALPPRPGIELLRTRWGPMYGFENDSGVSEALRRFGEYGSNEVKLYRLLLAPGDTVIDVGCNIGVISRALAVQPPHPTIIGFEPQPDCYRLASANTFHNPGVTVYPLAVADRAGTVTVDEFELTRTANYGSNDIDEHRQWHRRLPCPSVRLDDFLAPRAPRPRLVKIDAEGMEARILRGMTDLVHDRLVISAEADRRPLVPDILAALQALGCSCHVAMFRAIGPDNPRFDPESRHCRNLHIHLVGFAGPVPDWIPTVRGLWPVRSMEDFDAVVDEHFNRRWVADGGGPVG
ncbi:FkbM family methyltransferase [Thalassobaculum sp.]|uniref:FkbM family methyltransferase n=1 Tax=Thalassobaculum sp. TaxID=2022740 RepID=UPI0032ECF6DB